MTQYLRGSFSVGPKPGENKELDENWERTFGGKKASDSLPEPDGAVVSREVHRALEPLEEQVAAGLAENEALRRTLAEIHRLARDASAKSMQGVRMDDTWDTLVALTREYA